MTESTGRPGPLTVGQVADAFGVTVRTLHHYDETGLLVPSDRSPAGYRLYTQADLDRLQTIVVYRRLGFTLADVARLLAGDGSTVEHLRRQRASVMSRLEELSGLVHAIDRALEAHMKGYRITPEEQRELFGAEFDEGYATEAEQRWGESAAWETSQRRARSYSREQWEAIKAEGDRVNARYVQLMQAGEPADGSAAMDVAEEARQHICRWFYDCPRPMHAGIAELYVTDPRFQATYEKVAPGLAAYVHQAVTANARREG